MIPIIPIAHDALFKAFLSDISVARDFLEAHLPETIKPHCDFSTLKIQPTAFVDEDLKQHVADILYCVEIKGRPGYFYALIEHETQPSPLTAWRMLRYSVATIQRHLKEHGGTKLPIVVPLLFYRGKRSPYPYSLSVVDCFADPDLARGLWLAPYPLIDLTIIPDDELRTHKSVALLQLVQKHIHTRDMLELVGDIVQYLALGTASSDLVKSLLYYIAHEGECSNYGEFFNTLVEQNHRYREDVMTIAQQLEQKGRKETLQQIASQMLAKGLDRTVIKEYTQLSDQELDQLRH